MRRSEKSFKKRRQPSTVQFYNLLVNQKASYLFTYPPIFDTKNSELNALIVDTLGDDYAKKCKDLCVNASNSGIAMASLLAR